jgi:hypothetical protein
MRHTRFLNACIAGLVLIALAGSASALGVERWTDATPYGTFFNDYDPNFQVGFVPRVQERDRIKMHVARGNQLRVRMVLTDATIDNFLTDQKTKRDLYKELIDSGVIVLTTNTAWEDYEKRYAAAQIDEKVARKSRLSPKAWRELNLQTMQDTNPDRLYHIQKDFDAMVADWGALIRANPVPEDLEQKLALVNELFRNRIFLSNLDDEREAAFDQLVGQAHMGGDDAAFRAGTEAFFADITDGIYSIDAGRIDYWEYTAIYPAGSYDTTTKHEGRTIPMITTPGIWDLKPRKYGNGMVGMVDYISAAGYYGLIPMFPYEYGGGSAYNSIHNTGISNWIAGHRLLPKEWREYTTGSRSGKPFNRVALTSRGPVSHGCTRLNSGHLAELRELLPSTSEAMEGIRTFRNISHCYDVFDRHGDGKDEIMGVQYYIAFRHTKSRVAKQIWSQNNRDDFYAWMYADEMNYGPIGQVTFPEVCTGKFVKGKAREGKAYQGLTLYEAPYQPETLQFYKIKGVNGISNAGMEFNRELRRVGYGYQIDRSKLRLK